MSSFPKRIDLKSVWFFKMYEYVLIFIPQGLDIWGI